MCGVLGFVAIDEKALPGAERFERALDVLVQRGPDDRGLWRGPAALLGHTRLAIIDLSPAGHQPMVSADGRYVIVFNGEIYNFQALRREIELEGVSLRSHSDTEVLLELYARQGPGCLARLRGMFAFAVWDVQRQELFLARDRLGVKPLYVWRTERTLAFASELRALRALPGAPTELNLDAVRGFLSWGSIPTPATMLQGIEAMRPGTWSRWAAGTYEEHTYWSVPTEVRYRDRDVALEVLRPELLEAVRLRCVADVPVGAFLSGGIDSSSVVALMRAAGQADLRTLSIVMEGSELDESVHAERIARTFETTHTVLQASERDIMRELPRFFNAFDQPTIDGLNTYVVSQLAKQANLTVALSGLGGDELFGGYPQFRRAQAVEPWLDFVPQPVRSALGNLASQMHPRFAKFEALGYAASAVVQNFIAARGIFFPIQIAKLLNWDVADSVARDLEVLRESGSAYHVTMRLELRRYMHDQLLRDSDVFGMAHALEIRVPLIDHKVVEIVAATDEAAVMQGRHKALLRDALPRPLPRECVERTKMGFTLPFDRWMRTTWKQTVEESLLASSPRSDAILNRGAVEQVWRSFLTGQLHWSRPWTLFVLKRWLIQS